VGRAVPALQGRSARELPRSSRTDRSAGSGRQRLGAPARAGSTRAQNRAFVHVRTRRPKGGSQWIVRASGDRVRGAHAASLLDAEGRPRRSRRRHRVPLCARPRERRRPTERFACRSRHRARRRAIGLAGRDENDERDRISHRFDQPSFRESLALFCGRLGRSEFALPWHFTCRTKCAGKLAQMRTDEPRAPCLPAAGGGYSPHETLCIFWESSTCPTKSEAATPAIPRGPIRPLPTVAHRPRPSPRLGTLP
jgi:hypothetical protein